LTIYFNLRVQVLDKPTTVFRVNLITNASVDMVGEALKFEHEAKASRANKLAC
jgi:hypothetical protein